MEELKEDIKRVGKETKEKVEEKINVASEFVEKVKGKEYIFSGDAVVAAGIALGGTLIALIGKAISLDKKNEKLEEELDRKNFDNGVLVGRVSELRNSEAMRKKSEKQDSQE